MKIYTRTGDRGETGLVGGDRVPKDHQRIDAYGTVDELNALIGITRCGILGTTGMDDVDRLLLSIQHRLFDLGAELATPCPEQKDTALLATHHVEALERAIDRFDEELPPLRQFVLPGGTRLAAELHVARCVARRAERLVVALSRDAELRDLPVIYLNRLSDLLFVLARLANHRQGTADVPWQQD